MYSSAHIAVFAFPFGTHAAPLLNLVRRLAVLVPDDVKFSFFGTAESNRSTFSGAKGDEFQKIKAYDVWDGIPDGHVFSGNTHFEAPMRLFINATPNNFEKAMKVAEEETGVKVSCLLTDAFLWFACDLAEKIGVPWLSFWTAASCSLSAHLYTDDIRRVVATTDKAQQKLEWIPGLQAININDSPKEVLMDDEQSPLALMLHNMALKLPRTTAVVLNSFEEIDQEITIDLKSKLQKFLNVGPSHLMMAASSETSRSPDDNNIDESLSWLEKQTCASVVYISFGSITTPPPNEIVELAEALETCMVPFLWSLREHAMKNLPVGFTDRSSKYGKFVLWAPQEQVLASGKVGVFVTHCGWNSILESISYGVPMICRPFLGDQHLNSRMIEDKWRIGLRVDKDGVLTKTGTINAIQLILSSDKGKEIKRNVQVLKGHAMDAVKPNGSSTRNLQELLEELKKS